MPTGRLQGQIQVGDFVKIVGQVVSIADGTQPTITILTKYPNFAATKTNITVDAIQADRDE